MWSKKVEKSSCRRRSCKAENWNEAETRNLFLSISKIQRLETSLEAPNGEIAWSGPELKEGKECNNRLPAILTRKGARNGIQEK